MTTRQQDYKTIRLFLQQLLSVQMAQYKRGRKTVYNDPGHFMVHGLPWHMTAKALTQDKPIIAVAAQYFNLNINW